MYGAAKICSQGTILVLTYQIHFLGSVIRLNFHENQQTNQPIFIEVLSTFYIKDSLSI